MMARFPHSDVFLAVRPHRVVFEGFQSDTFTLQRWGWKIAAEMDREVATQYNVHRILLEHSQSKLKMMGVADPRSYRYGNEPYDQELEFRVRHCVSNMTLMVHDDFSSFQEVDATPRRMAETRDFDSFKIFAPKEVKTEEILVEPSSVAECLDLIHRLQAPALSDIRKRRATAATQIHAQILSVA